MYKNMFSYISHPEISIKRLTRFKKNKQLKQEVSIIDFVAHMSWKTIRI